ncbi:MAG: DUF3078 domain-containing protein [Flavobacteriales bacterium]|nr:DUF3078 domain-containing protein [Flavobacteriales bacterium]
MRKILFAGLSVLFMGIATYAQDTTTEADLKKKKKKEGEKEVADGWKKGGVFNLGFSQTSLTNWAAGGVNSLSLNGLLNAFANYKKGKSTWDNNLNIGLGSIKQGDADWFKNDDVIDFTSKYGRQAFSDWYYAGLINFRTQLLDGFNSPEDSIRISSLLAPGYLLGAIGMDYKPNDEFSLFIAPLTSKTTFVMDDFLAAQGAFGVDPGENIRNEFGGYIRMLYQKKEIVKNVNFTTKLDLFSNYLNNPQNIDIVWENLVAMKVNKYLGLTFNTLLLYDDDITIVGEDSDGNAFAGPRTQFKEVFTAGFTYKF